MITIVLYNSIVNLTLTGKLTCFLYHLLSEEGSVIVLRLNFYLFTARLN